MAYQIDEAIKEIEAADDQSVSRPNLPTDELIKKYEALTGFIFPDDYKLFLKRVGTAFVGTLNPLILSPTLEPEFGELADALSQGRDIGLPSDWLPFCEDNGDFYCLTPDGQVRFWDHNGPGDESWDSLAIWIRDVWLDGG